jgi:hypothetical protein
MKDKPKTWDEILALGAKFPTKQMIIAALVRRLGGKVKLSLKELAAPYDEMLTSGDGGDHHIIEVK